MNVAAAVDTRAVDVVVVVAVAVVVDAAVDEDTFVVDAADCY